MSNGLTIIDKDYTRWVEALGTRYRQSQIKAAVKVNREMLRFYWELGRDIEVMCVEERWGESVIKNLSADLRRQIPNASGLSARNIYYAKKFYLLYAPYLKSLPQAVAQIEDKEAPQFAAQSSGFAQQAVERLGNKKVPQLAGQIEEMLFSIPWGHHRYLMDRYGKEPAKALFYAQKTMEEGWSRNMLFNFMNTDLYERQGKAQTNFSRTLPAPDSDLAQELTKDPYNFSFTGITGRYNEALLKDALLNNITRFLTELGTGFAYVGKEYRLQIGEKERFVDLLFYHINLRCYVVVEVKIGEFDFADLGQLSGYVVTCNHTLRKEGRDNPTIGLLVCREKDTLIAQYALEGSNQPLGIRNMSSLSSTLKRLRALSRL